MVYDKDSTPTYTSTSSTSRGDYEDNKLQFELLRADIMQEERQRRSSTQFSTRSRNSSRGRPSIDSSSDARRRSSTNGSGRRKRDIFWQNSLWDMNGKYPEGPRIRAMSQSVNVTHPEVAEERMRAMYPRWRN